MTSRSWIATALVLGAVGVRPAQADTRKLAADGTMHVIEIQSVGSGKGAGTALRHTRQGVHAAAQAIFVPGTEDLAIDRDPSIEIDPQSGALVLVWSRYDGTDYDVFASRFNGAAWSAPVAIINATGDDVEPQLRITKHFVHISWRQIAAGQSSLFSASLLTSTMTPAYGPERVRVDDLWAIPSEGTTTPSLPDPTPAERFFATVLFTPDPSEPGRAHIWGVRDEPVPIGYRECLILPAAVRSVSSVEAGWVGGRFTFWFVSGSRFYYATRANGAWSPTRSVDLVPGVSATDARWIVHDLNVRSTAN